MITCNDIRIYLGLPVVDKQIHVHQVDAVGVAENTLMFINKPGMELEYLDKSVNSVYLIDESYPEYPSRYNDFIRVKNPKYKFCLVVENFELYSKFQRAFLANAAYYSNPTVHCKECIIGENCHIDPGVIIGGTDFSPVIGDDRYHLVQFPQMGGVHIGDNVTIKYNTMIGKGTFGYTVIDDNTMIDYGCQIGHNCYIGNACIIAAGTIIGGSTTVGDCTTIGIGAKIRNGLKIGKNVSIGMGAVVIRDIPDNCVVVGNPARIIDHKPMFDERGLV